MFMDIPLKVVQQCWERLNKPGLTDYEFNDNGNENIFKSSLDIFILKRWIPAVVTGESLISLYKSETFYVFQSKINHQLLTEAGGCFKYCCEYLSKTDKQNYINISMDNENKGSYASNSTHIHNTETNSSDIQQ